MEFQKKTPEENTMVEILKSNKKKGASKSKYEGRNSKKGQNNRIK
jgi:hypothetical protein